jgi:hypothetical protein
MYTDPRVTYEFVDVASGNQIEVETAAAICRRIGATSDTAAANPAGSVAHDGIRCPTGGSIEAFGVTLTEALTNANATHCVIALKVVNKEGGTTTTVANITLPKDSTEVTVANARGSDGSPTAAQCVAAGARILSSDTDIPYLIPQGGVAYVEVTQAAGAAGGAFRPFLVIRHNGQPDPGPVASSPVLLIAS